jgi:hypothetical protein
MTSCEARHDTPTALRTSGDARCAQTASGDTLRRLAHSADDSVGCGVHDIADELPGVPMSSIKVAIRILLHGDWIYDALGAGREAAGDVSAGVLWMCVQSAAVNAQCFMPDVFFVFGSVL